MSFGQDSAFYMPTLQEVEPETLRLFETYSMLPANQVVSHIETIRERAWKIFPYPCIGGFHFIELSLSELPIYPEVLSRVHNGESFLDVGCCFGQDIRKLVFDGAPSDKIYGSDLDHRFLDLGFELFRDASTLQATWIPADALALDSDLNQLQGKLDIIHASSFFHLFSLSVQKTAAKNLLRLLERKPDRLIVGRQVGDLKSIGTEQNSVINNNDAFVKEFFWHNSETWRKMWEEVAADVGVKVKVESELVWDEKHFNAPGKMRLGEGKYGQNTRKMEFVIRTV